MNSRHFIAFCLLIAAHVSLFAQYTAVYQEGNSLYRQGSEAFERENYSLAQQKFEEFLALPANAATHITDHDDRIAAAFKAAICAKKLRHPNTVHLLTEFTRNYGNNRQYLSRANYELVQIFFKKKEFAGIIALENQTYPQDLTSKESNQLHFMVAYGYLVSKNFDKAKERFEKIAGKGEYGGDANYYLGFIEYDKKEYDKALQYFRAAEQEKKYQAAMPYYITLIMFQKKDYGGVISYAEPKLSNKGLKYERELRKMVGQVYYEQQNYQKALPHLQYYVEKSAKVSKEDLYILGFTQYQFGLYDKAIANFLELNTLQDSIGQNAMYHLADCYLKTNEKEKALASFESAARLSFDAEIKEAAIFNTGKVAYELQQYSKAINTLKDFIFAYPNSRYSGEAQDLLGKLFDTSKNYVEAIEIIEKIPNKTSALQVAYQRVTFNRGVDLFNSRDYDNALINFDKSLQYSQDRNLNALANFWKAEILFKNNRFSDAITAYSNYITSNPSSLTYTDANVGTANYSIGYCYFKQRNFAQAGDYFDRSATGLQQSNRERLLADAILRSGDCYFMQKNYPKAQQRYDEVVQRGGSGADYALYQTGMIFGLNKNYTQKINTLQKVKSNYTNSDFADDAVYQTAVTYALQEDHRSAIASYRQLIESYPDSKYYATALNEIGLAYYNLGMFNEALQAYQRLISEQPDLPEAKEALTNIRDVYLSLGKSDEYFDFLKRAPVQVQSTASQQEKDLYQFAEVAFERGDCTVAIRDFTKYINSYPYGSNALYAHFYRGECLYANKQYTDAQPDYDYVLQSNSNLFREKAMDKAARIAFYINKNYASAYDYYKQILKNNSSNKETQAEALRGMVRTCYELRKFSELETYGKQLLASNDVSHEHAAEAHYYLGKMYIEQSKWSDAKSKMEQVAKANTNEMGAEARYWLAYIAFKQNELDKSKDACYRVDRETPGFVYWVAKAFVLLGDIYEKKNDFYQAKATYQSVADNYTGDPDLMAEAREKLQKAEAKLRSNSKLDSGDKTKELEMDESGGE
ncbi:MAG: tetratricopeptide repeat protein [Sphingobacteriales bacterium]|nr:tetratricopeptide repeat protein [Sphingobacteriales bacterium]